jgi:hypothetical protein
VNGARYPGVVSDEIEKYDHKNLLKHSMLMGLVYWTVCVLFLGLAGYFIAVHAGCIKLPLRIATSQIR